MYVRSEIADRGPNPLIEGASEGEMAAQAHAGGADSAIAVLQVREHVDGERGVFVVGREFLLDLPRIAFVCAWTVVGECFWARKLVIAGWRRNDVAVAGDLAGEALDWSGYWAEDG